MTTRANKFGVEPTAPAGAALVDQYGSVNHSYLINRFCSSTLADAGEFYNKKTGLGYKGAVYLTGEEGGDESRGFAGNQDGEFVQVPGFGLAAWETFVNAPTTSNATVVMGNEDGSQQLIANYLCMPAPRQKLVSGMKKQALQTASFM